MTKNPWPQRPVSNIEPDLVQPTYPQEHHTQTKRTVPMTNNFNRSDNTLIMFINGLGVAVAYGMLGISLWLSTDVPLATKGYWGIGIMMLTLALVNFVKYRFDDRLSEDRLMRIEEARNEKLLEEFVTDKAA